MNDDWRQRVEDLLVERGLSRAELSRRMGRDESYIKKVLKPGGAQPRLDTVLALRDALDVPLSFLIDGIDDDPVLDSIARKLAQLSVDDAKTVDAVVTSLLKARSKP